MIFFRNQRHAVCRALVVLFVIAAGARCASAQSPPADSQSEETGAHDEPKSSRLFGVLPNSSTIEAGFTAPPITTRQAFKFATEDSFDKMVYPFVGAVAYLGVGQPQVSYWQRYALAFADNTVGNYMGTGVFPTVFHQDPRYFQLGTGTIWRRMAYAASRTVVTRTRDGSPAFNISELGGNTAAAWISNAYYPAAERSVGTTMSRAGSQVIYDAVSYELKEFWPDIRQHFKHTFHRH